MATKEQNEDKITQVYLRSDDHSWIPALQLKTFDNKATVAVPKFRTEQEMMNCSKERKIKTYHDSHVIDLSDYPNNVLPMQNVDHNGNLQDYKDMVELPFLHEAAILYNLKLRHINENPYTRTGDILIAVNPYQWYDDLYTEEKRAYYSNRLVWDSSQEDPRAVIQPHVYEVSALAYKGLANGGNDQSILVSGESGAGKTETVKICLNHIASVQHGQVPVGYYEDSDMNPVVRRVVQSNPLLEAFGNAKTRRNDNSSRFGKYLQLQFDKNSSNSIGIKTARVGLVGSKCEVYLLEKNRVISHNSEERTFHIFYQLLAAPDSLKAQFWKGLKGANTNSFSYIGHSDTDTIEGMSDANRFNETIEALELVGVKGGKLDALMKALCIVLQLGNLGFDSKNGDTDKSIVSTKQELDALADLMGVCSKELTQAFTERTFVTRDESHKVPLNRDMAKDACDALAKEAYQKLFLWLVGAINEATSAAPGQKYGTIGLLDIFGFEVFEVNRFEQLCINYANEKLQQKFTQDIFTSVQAEYEAEGIGLEDIWYDDNSDVLDLIEGPTGLLALLNEECVRPQGSDFAYVQKCLQINKESPCLVVHRTDRLSFGIKHYAGGVMYDGEMFVSSNIDTLPLDLQKCAENSANEILSKPRVEQTPSRPKSPVRGRGPRGQSTIVAATVWTKYRDQLSQLMTSLHKTESRYIRCIKPNGKKKPSIMEHNLVVEQLRCAGVVAGITITRSVFPNRLPNSLVLARYSNMADGKLGRSQGSGTVEERRADQCKTLLNWALKEKEMVDENGRKVKAFVVGKTKTYFRAGALEWLESHRVQGLDSLAVVIQKAARGWLARNKGKNERQLRKMADLEKEMKKKAAIQHKEEMEKRAAQRRAEHLKEQQDLLDGIEKIEKELRYEQEEGPNRLREARERVAQLEAEKEELEEKVEQDSQKKVREALATKSRQEKKIEEARKLIEYLKKENKKLRKTEGKVETKHEEETEHSERLHDSFCNLENSISDLGESAIKVEAKNHSLVTTLDENKALNKELKEKVMKSQDRYMEQAEMRLELQKSMARILTMIQERCKDRDIVEEAIVVALEAETEAKSIMMELDTETTEPALILSDVSENELEYSDDSSAN